LSVVIRPNGVYQMSFFESKQAFLLSSLRFGREGVECERSIRALSYIFHCWAHYGKSRKPLENGKPDGGILPIIAFEKLGVLWCRLWEQFWKIRGARDERKASAAFVTDTGKNFRFPHPFLVAQAKHGKRLQRHDGLEKPVTLAELLHGLQQDGIRYFDIHTTGDQTDPNHYKTTVHATLPSSAGDQLPDGFSAIESECLKELSRIIKRLGTSQIRALGTHESVSETILDIKFETDRIVYWMGQAAINLKDGGSFFESSQEMLEYADEAYRKSLGNRQDYEEAYSIFLSQVDNPLVKEAFENCQAPASAIWDAPEVIHLAEWSRATLAVAKCLTAIAYFGDHTNERDQARPKKQVLEMKHRWREGQQGLQKHSISGIPSDLSGLYADGGLQLKTTVRDRLLEIIEQLRS